MNRNLYQVRPLIKASFKQQLFKQFPPDNAIIELNNLLATKEVMRITQSDMHSIENRYKLSLYNQYQLNLEEFYAVYLNSCLDDDIMSRQESVELDHLKFILGLDSYTVNELHVKIGGLAYKRAFSKAIEDGHVTPEKEGFLDKLARALQLPATLIEAISAEARQTYMEHYVTRMMADKRVSPEDEQQLNALAQSLQPDFKMNTQTQEEVAKLKLYWELENLALPVVQPDIIIQKSETCYASVSDVNWYELRKAAGGKRYSGYASPVKVVKGFYLNPDGRSLKSYGIDKMVLIDTGNLYLTNKRIIFTGGKKNTVIRFEKILGITPYTDAVEIEKETGKSPLIQIPKDVDLFCIILERLLNER